MIIKSILSFSDTKLFCTIITFRTQLLSEIVYFIIHKSVKVSKLQKCFDRLNCISKNILHIFLFTWLSNIRLYFFKKTNVYNWFKWNTFAIKTYFRSPWSIMPSWPGAGRGRSSSYSWMFCPWWTFSNSQLVQVVSFSHFIWILEPHFSKYIPNIHMGLKILCFSSSIKKY